MTRLAWLDALRGWAAVTVAVFHLSPVVLGSERHLRLFEIFDLGKYGVLLFFLVSGYVIPMSLERHGSLRRFWIGRIFRIYPAYLLAVVAGLALGAAGVVRLPGQLGAETTATIAGHLTMLQDLTGTRGVLRPFWTLSFEMVFYLIVAGLFAWRRHRVSAWWAAGLTAAALGAGAALPGDLFGAGAGQRRITAVAVLVLLAGGLCAYLTGRRRLVLAAAAGGICATALPLLNGHASDQVTSASSAQAVQMLAVLFAGTVIYRLQHRQIGRPVAAMSLALVCAGVAVHLEPGVAAAVAGTFAIAFVLRDRRVPAVLGWLGTVSYSLYLLHIPVLAVMNRLFDQPLLIAVAFTAGALGAAWAGHRLVELPGQALGRRLTVIEIATEGMDARTARFGKRYESV
ncbi:acyltransferase [Actinoplanes sp. NEAU-A12]|uniref:Acyltransferase n=1 Tax=Actinoplanes sandaracinus TaxID=3045177 RepID=A0ABT6WK72_9ACTN|nr:acyltransferase [Actinoplanes sandaracinus]MDI6100135.1 acyltransferase [Actinoplanes sandaracinus]